MSKKVSYVIFVITIMALVLTACAPATTAPETAAPVAPAATEGGAPAAGTNWCSNTKIVFFPGGTPGGGFETVVYNGALAFKVFLLPGLACAVIQSIAAMLAQVGIKVTFLPESQARTADLECRLGRERFFVEVTAMVGSAERQRLPLRGLLLDEAGMDETDRGVILIHRILARIQQKARQLVDYCDPVILSLSIPRADLQGEKRSRPQDIWLDLKMLAGSVTVLLTRLRSLSAVMVSLWDVEPMPSKAGTRLANVDVIERPKQKRGYPRVRLLIKNPVANAPISERQQEGFAGLL